MAKRIFLEGTWSGYTAEQCRVVHRERVTPSRAEKLKVRRIVYTDGTCLILRVREAKPREAVFEMHSYSSLIREAEISGQECFHV